MDNAEVARIFDEVADLLEIQNESQFRVRAYRTAARTIRALAESTGRSYGFVHRVLSEAGVTMRGRGGATRGKAKS